MISPIGTTGFQFPATVYNPAPSGTSAASAGTASPGTEKGIAGLSTVSASFSASQTIQAFNSPLDNSAMAALALLALRDNDKEGGLSPAQKFFLMMLVLGLFNNNFNAGYQSGSLDYTLNVAGGLPLAYSSAAGIISDILTPGLFVNMVV